MALSFPITFSLAPLSTGLSLDANQYGQALVANLQATISGAFLTGQIGGLAPTSDVGPWANNGHWWFWDTGTLMYVQESLTSNFPTGCVLEFGGVSAPTGFLVCNGSAQLRTTFAALFAVIGVSFGIGDGSSTFNLPDFRGRTPIGVGTGTGLTARVMGAQIGGENTTLSTPNLPSHAHSITDVLHNHAQNSHLHNVSSQDPGHFHTSPAHGHTIPFTTFAGAALGGGATVNYIISNASSTSTVAVGINGSFTGIVNTANATAVNVASLSGITSTNSTGTGTAFSNMQPSLVINFIIKT